MFNGPEPNSYTAYVMKIYLVRHGETVWNVENRIQGHLDSPVTEAGIRQISALCRDLADKSITLIVASTLGRSVTAAGQIASWLDCPLQFEPAFVERHFGEFEGKRLAELTEKERVQAVAMLSGSSDIGPQNGETLQDATRRVLSALSGLSSGQGNICVVSHGHVIQSVISTLSGNNAEHFARYAHLNGAYSVLACTEKGLTVEKWGVATHLFSRHT